MNNKNNINRREKSSARRTALITGGGTGIGLAIAQILYKEHGLNVVLVGRNEERLKTASASLENGAGFCKIHAADIGTEAGVQSVLSFLYAEEICVDVLVNNAGILTNTPLLQMEDADIVQHIHINALAALRLIRALVPNMAVAGFGRIVNISSGWGSFAEGLGPGAYGISKVLLNAVTVKLAEELPVNVKINSCCPGWVRTNMGGTSAPRMPEEGAETPVWLATLPNDGPTGSFFRDKKPIKW